MGSKLEAALALAAKGFRVFPIKPGAKHPPLLTGWPTKATSDPALVEMYWTPMPDANIGIHCEGLVVIDVDPRKGGNESLDKLRLLHDLPDTLLTNTPSGGRHLFYKLGEGHGGVPNSVGFLGDGLDIRSTGGYVVAPGSQVAAGVYVFEHPGVAIADAPEWLVVRLGRSPDRAASPVAPVADAAEAVLGRARDWLVGQEGAVEGQGGDARTFAVACGLRDLGVSQGQALTLLLEGWNDRCSPPWDTLALRTKVRNAYDFASGEAGSKAALPTDFPIVPEVGTDVPKTGIPSNLQTGGKALLTLAQFAALEGVAAGYVIKGLLLRASYAETFGAPGEGKTFVALDQAYHVAAGREWMGRKVHAGPVLYLAYEGRGGMVKRAKALRQKYGEKDVPLFIVGAAFNLREKAGRQELGAVVAQLPAKPVLIVIDTFARALMGGDENSAQDVGAFNSAIAALIESTGACVMIIHHSGKDKSKGARGSSALLGAIDTEIEVDDDQVIARKQRDIEISEPIGFKLVPMVVGMDADGDETTSCTVEGAQASTVKRLSLKGKPMRGFKALKALSPNNAPVDIEDWKTACREFSSPGRIGGDFYDIKNGLLDTGHIKIEDGKVTRRME